MDIKWVLTKKFSLELWKDGVPIVIDKLKVDHTDIDNIASLRGFPVFGTFLISANDHDILERVRDLITENDSYIAGATQVDEFIIIRCLSSKTHLIQELFRTIWIELRHLIIGKESVPPRIWLT